MVVLSHFQNSNKQYLHGVSKIFYKSGNIYQSIPYNNGIREGFILEYTPNGNLSSKIFYLNEIN